MERLEILLSEEFRRTVEANLARDPMRVALDRAVPHAAEVASQVKYLSRAQTKLPSYHSARCVIPSIAFEQSSSEAAAGRKRHSGGAALDLTCGLGVDSLALARRFERVVSIERDEFLAAVARENFNRLGVDNIQVINCLAEDLVRSTDQSFDLVYADPDRRNAAGKKMVRIEDCSPDILTLLPYIQRIASRLTVKLSPMFDVDEVRRIFGQQCNVEVVSIDGECKEVIADMDFRATSSGSIRAVAMTTGKIEQEYSVDPSETDCEISVHPFEPDRYKWLIVPDVALQKSRLAKRYYSQRGAWIESDNGYAFSTEKPSEIMGKAIEIESISPFDPKKLKHQFKAKGTRNIDILRRDFPLSAAEIARQTGLREGGTTAIAFTRAAERLWQIYLTKR